MGGKFSSSAKTPLLGLFGRQIGLDLHPTVRLITFLHFN